MNTISQPVDTSSSDSVCSNFLDRYAAIRTWTVSLCQGLSAEDVTPQSMADASPVKWHLAHTTWFFETFVLEKHDPNYQVLNLEYKVLFNSYYNSVGEQYLRPQRGLITRPSLEEVFHYRDYVDQHMQALLATQQTLSEELRYVIEIGLQHEQQHQELILTDVKHLFSFNPLSPVYCAAPEFAEQNAVAEMEWLGYKEGVRQLGHDGEGFSFDNENPKHKVLVHAFEMASRLVTNGEYLKFIEDGGYERAELWLSDAWQLLKTQRWQAPLYWKKHKDQWHYFTLSGLREVQLAEPVAHVSFYEADAYARWLGVRLPTEFEWESVAQQANLDGHFVEDKCFHPRAITEKTNNSRATVQQLFGDVWEWTASPYTAYPGYRTADGELAEYNGKFMCNQMVLRGGSCVTPKSHIRASYRNFFPASARWQFSGIRLARDLK